MPAVIQARFVRRALLRAVMAAAFAAVVARRGWRSPACWAAACVGAAQELPVAGAALAPFWARSHRHSGVSAPKSVSVGLAAGLLTRRVWPVAPRTAADIRPALRALDGREPSEDGAGLTFVVNSAAGPAYRRNPIDEVREAFPAAEVLEVGESLDMACALKRAAASSLAIGVAGGDGSISAAAAVAHVVDKPLVVVPAGTLNHLARDLGVTGVEDAAAAVQAGRTVAVDVGSIDGKTFLNTASFGAYTELVDARERLEGTLGKWPALVVALVQVLRRSTPVRVELDGHERLLWMTFVGNCHYRPSGFAPSWRERLDDGQLDVRLVDADQRFARLRLLLAVLTGRLGRCRVYEAFTTTSLKVRSLDGPLRLARDGETFDGSDSFEICKEDRPLAVYVPPPPEDA